jgi:hypothetical protein
MLTRIDRINEDIARLSQVIEQLLPHEEQLQQAESMPGRGRRAAQDVIAETGTDMTRFPTPGHLASWCGRTPAGRAGGLIQPGHGEPAHHPHRGEGVPDSAAEQPLGLVRRPVPACAAIVHPLRRGSWLMTAAAYLPACRHGSVRAKHGRSSSSSSARFRRASAAPILAAAAAFGLVVSANA